jgi:hypothetical protein
MRMPTPSARLMQDYPGDFSLSIEMRTPPKISTPPSALEGIMPLHQKIVSDL